MTSRWSRLLGSLLLALVQLCTVTGQGSAICDMEPNSALTSSEQQPITGTVQLSQSSSGLSTLITVTLSGFNTSDAHTLHGFHIHEKGDMSAGCTSTGSHYNPFSKPHAAPWNTSRHVGDLGNLIEDSQGKVSKVWSDDVVELAGTYSVIGKAMVIHEKMDDLGLGGDAGSTSTGNAGGRLACCIITSGVHRSVGHLTLVTVIVTAVTLSFSVDYIT